MNEKTDDAASMVVLNPGEVRPVFVDWFVSAGYSEGIISLVLGSVDPTPISGSNDVDNVTITANLKMTLDFGLRLAELIQSHQEVIRTQIPTEEKDKEE